MTTDEMKQELKRTLKPERYTHSLAVAETAVMLSEIYGADCRKAYLAGLLHDCAKGFGKEELYAELKRYHISADEVSLGSPGLLHGFVGAEVAKNVYGVDDKEIYDAIYYHTVGKADMPLLTKIIYLADGIEPGRIYDGVDRVRLEAVKNIDRAVVMYTDSTIKYVLERGGLLHPSAVETRNYYLINA